MVTAVLVWAWATSRPIDLLAVVAGLTIVVPDAVRLYEANALNAARRHESFTVWTVADALARPLGAAVGISLIGPTAGAALTGVTVAAVAVNLVAQRAIDRDASTAPPAAWRDEMRVRVRRFAMPLIPLAVLVWTIGVADRYVLATVGGTSAAGMYAAAYGLGSQGFLALGLFGLTVFRPPFFNAFERADAGAARRVLGFWLTTMLAGSAAGIAVLALFGDLVARVCLGPEFRSAASLLPWIGAAYALQTMQTVFEALLYAKHKTNLLLPVQIAGAATALASYAVLIPRYGAWGAAVATLAAFGVSSVLAAILGDLAGTLRTKRTAAAAGA
jgi:O-antigen/teichoic acid export membrane protein